MSDRPGNGGPEDGPDYQWLYGGKGAPPEDPQVTRPVPRQHRDRRAEETRMMRAQPRHDERRASARPTPCLLYTSPSPRDS